MANLSKREGREHYQAGLNTSLDSTPQKSHRHQLVFSWHRLFPGVEANGYIKTAEKIKLKLTAVTDLQGKQATSEDS